MTPHNTFHGIAQSPDPLTDSEMAMARRITRLLVADHRESVEDLTPAGRAIVGLCLNSLARIFVGKHRAVAELHYTHIAVHDDVMLCGRIGGRMETDIDRATCPACREILKEVEP